MKVNKVPMPGGWRLAFNVGLVGMILLMFVMVGSGAVYRVMEIKSIVLWETLVMGLLVLAILLFARIVVGGLRGLDYRPGFMKRDPGKVELAVLSVVLVLGSWALLLLSISGVLGMVSGEVPINPVTVSIVAFGLLFGPLAISALVCDLKRYDFYLRPEIVSEGR